MCCMLLAGIINNRAFGRCNGHTKPSSTYVLGSRPSKFEKPSGLCYIRHAVGMNKDCQRIGTIRARADFSSSLRCWITSLY